MRSRLASEPDDGALWNELGHVLQARADFQGAEAAFRRAIDRYEQLAATTNANTSANAPNVNTSANAANANAAALEPRVNLAVLLVRRGAGVEAAQHFEAALRLAPDDPLVLSNLGALCRMQGQLERAFLLLQRSLARAPDRAAAQLNFGLVLSDQGRAAEALPHLERAVELAPNALLHHDSLLLQLHYVSLDAARIASAHRRYGQIAAAAAKLAPPLPPSLPRELSPDRRLRVGLVSPDLRQHSVAFFMEPILVHHDRERLAIVAYGDAAHEDDVSARLRRQCEAWHPVAALSDDALARLVRADAIDVLIDLAGHTANNRLSLFARRAAPLQISYIGYPDTTGLATMDYRITDAWVDPPTAPPAGDPSRADEAAVDAMDERLYMDDGFLVYAPPSPSPDLAPPPSDTGAPVTFGSFNALNKLSDETLALWARVLDGARDARLLLKHPRLSEPATRQRLAQRLQSRGLDAARVTFAGHSPSLTEHLAAYGAVDLALDTFPYHGTTTSCDALWMGVPVVTLAGATPVSRVGVSLLERAGLRELVAATPDDYVAIALSLAADRPRLRALRSSARERLRHGGLVDGARGAGSFERALRSAWRRYLATRG